MLQEMQLNVERTDAATVKALEISEGVSRHVLLALCVLCCLTASNVYLAALATAVVAAGHVRGEIIPPHPLHALKQTTPWHAPHAHARSHH